MYIYICKHTHIHLFSKALEAFVKEPMILLGGIPTVFMAQ